MKTNYPRQILLIAAVLILAAFAAPTYAGLSGAVYTGLQDGSAVNANLFEAKEDVYLRGGPGPHAPSTAAALPAGDYYFQVTDPSGKKLLSEDPVKCRRFTVSDDGVITAVVATTFLDKVKGQMIEVSCEHKTAIDIDRQHLGALTVQLMPYKDTPNRGGVYKLWVTPVEKFVGDPELVDNPEYFHGFVPAWCKTDNYKVREDTRYETPIIIARKFDDSNANGVWDPGEVEIGAWPIEITDPLGITNPGTTADGPILADPKGYWEITELTPAGEDWLQTALFIDGAAQAVSPVALVFVKGTSEETHEVVFGNIELGEIKACKFYDRNGDGIHDAAEPPVPGIVFVLTGTDVTGQTVEIQAVTDADGCALFAHLLPGDYTVTELPPVNWIVTTDIAVSLSLAEGQAEKVKFGDYCIALADFGTKGYWHNKNGLLETTPDDLDYLNTLAPYSAASSYFDAGDEPFDGYLSDGTPVAPVAGDFGEQIAPAGSALAEQSHFLLDSNAGGDPREQLAQQLDAFIMNARHRLDDPLAAVQLPTGDFISAQILINEAINLWQNGSAAEQTVIKDLLDLLNNADELVFIPYWPCDVIY